MTLAIETANRGLFAISACYAGDDWGFVCKPALDGLVDGVIAGTPHAGLVDILRKYVPVVLMDVPFSPGTFGLPVVNVNQRNGVWMLARRLHELGHRSVALLDIANDLFAPARTSHFREAAGHYGIKIHPASGAPREISPATHEAVMRSFAELVAPLAKHGEISAVVCPGNTYATTLLENLGPLGVSVPGECSVTGFDSHVVGCHGVVSRVTGVGYPWRRLICAALDTLRRGIDHPGAPPVETLVEPELVEGETCAAAKFIGKKNTKTRGVSK